MARNVEIKARLADPAATRRIVEEAADGPPTSLRQTDTFFSVPSGRLKLREFGGGKAELIWYARTDATGPTESRFERLDVPDPPALRGLLAAALGVRGVVAKQRLLFRIGRTRIHLDTVQDLGSFLELEVEMAEGEMTEAGVAVAEGLMRWFGIGADALVAEAYIDLLAAGAPAAPRDSGKG